LTFNGHLISLPYVHGVNEMKSRMSIQSPDQPENGEVLRIFREIDRSPAMTQRELSSRMDISLGKVNFLINALIEKGFVKMENLRKSSSKGAYLYYLTPMGIEKKTRMTYLFLKEKIREYDRLAMEIQQLREEVRKSGLSSEEQDQSGNSL
jgi:EPS-associated MarR family transcriptional regulator